MKSTLIILIAFVIFGSVAQAQKHKKTDLSFGVKAGLNLARITNLNSSSSKSSFISTSSNISMLLGPQFGAFAIIPFTKLLSLQPELLLSTKGFKLNNTFIILGASSTSKATIKLYYIELPIQARVAVTQNFFLLAGPYVGILANATSKSINTSSNGASSETKSNTTNSFNSIDFGLTGV